ncbi:MAG: LysR family transcriptional regulator [Anaerolineae bacterium]|nr:LysR family transcriptional regulator [Anaerolineae bacterium]
MLDAHQLNVFLTAAETLNFTEAARLLSMTQPSVSQHVQALEQHFQTKLFNRAGRQLTLTDAGMALMPLARQLVRQSIRIDETMASLHGSIYGHLRFGCSTTSGKYVLPSLLGVFLKRHPRLHATCEVSSQKQAIEALREGRVHLALACPQESDRHDVDSRLFYSDPIVLLVPDTHPWAARGAVELREMREASLIMREEGSGTFNAVRQGLLRAGIELGDLQTVLTLGNSEAIALAVREGLGVGFVSGFVAQQLVREGVRHVDIDGLALRQDVYLLQSRRHPPTNAQTAFWQFSADADNQLCSQVADETVSKLQFAELAL